MITNTPSATAFGRRVVIVFSMLSALQLYGQSTPSSPSPAAVAKYDKNKNGVLDPDELALMQADQAKEGGAVKLTPFQVSTNKDRGYAAGNTLSGGRVDTPLELTPGSISV
ncbi:MAG: hypothetical protein NTV51_12775, partial [Verrucomicrobia bacterium]|nr:hypothetical protein [Verrucomicrobiota bacterium]